jgi:NADH-quinone oxidoreductase subunit B
MCEPKWVIAVGACACTGGMYNNYCTVQGISSLIPVNIYVPGCPPRAEAILDAVVQLQSKIEKESSLDRK